jgi:hypothetical protein
LAVFSSGRAGRKFVRPAREPEPFDVNVRSYAILRAGQDETFENLW